jgi:hypothetical protein
MKMIARTTCAHITPSRMGPKLRTAIAERIGAASLNLQGIGDF